MVSMVTESEMTLSIVWSR